MASTHQHSRSSGSSTSSNGSAYQLILDHILSYPGSYEIPLRTMYTLNCRPRGHPDSASSASSSASSPIVAQGESASTATFTQNLMAQLSNLPSQASSLPPTFLTSFVQRCFPSDLTRVDFPQALAGLDYLKDLEMRRRKEVAAAMERLDVDRNRLANDAADIAESYPGVSHWLKTIEEKERKIDSLYTQVYVGLRRWILINEMSLTPFNKHNCVAMLNTLYPPMGMATQPTTYLTPAIMKAQRDGFFKYIQSVERSGPSILHNLLAQGKGDSEATGWPAVARHLSMFLQVANSVIAECMTITSVQDVSPQKKRDPNPARHTRKADSGVSFAASDRRPSTRGSSTGEPASPLEPSRPKTPSGGRSTSTALEKLARGLKGIGRSRTNVTEMIHDDSPMPVPIVEKPKILRKMRSLGSLTDRKGSVSGASRQNSVAPAYDPEAMRRQRLEYEARQGKVKRASNEV